MGDFVRGKEEKVCIGRGEGEDYTSVETASIVDIVR
jgi:hypothetical protein